MTQPSPESAVTSHIPLITGLAWAMFIVEAAYRGSLIAYAYSRTNIYVWERFERNFGDLKILLSIDLILMVTGALLALVAMQMPSTKRWVATAALVGHLVLLLIHGGLAYLGGTFRA